MSLIWLVIISLTNMVLSCLPYHSCASYIKQSNHLCNCLQWVHVF